MTEIIASIERTTVTLLSRESPDHVFIKLYPARFRRIIRDHKLTPSLIGWLTVIALRIGNDNTCYPSLALIAEDANTTVRCAQVAIRKLRKLGIVKCYYAPGHSTRYALPEAFSYNGNDGASESHDQKIVTGYDPMITHPRSLDRVGGDQKITQKQIQASRSKEADPSRSRALPLPSQNGEEEENPLVEAKFRLMHIGFKAEIASQILMQYDLTEVDAAFNKLLLKRQAGKAIENQAGLFRSILEGDTRRKIKSPEEAIREQMEHTARQMTNNSKTAPKKTFSGGISKVFGDGRSVDALSNTPLGKARDTK